MCLKTEVDCRDVEQYLESRRRCLRRWRWAGWRGGGSWWWRRTWGGWERSSSFFCRSTCAVCSCCRAAGRRCRSRSPEGCRTGARRSHFPGRARWTSASRASSQCPEPAHLYLITHFYIKWCNLLGLIESFIRGEAMDFFWDGNHLAGPKSTAKIKN